MSATIPESHAAIFKGKSLAHIATVMTDGSPQVTPVWVDLEDGQVVFNTAEGRTKARNLGLNSKVALSVTDEANPYRYIQVRGTVVERTTEGADAHIDRMAKKYLGVDSYPGRNPAEQRVIFRIRPDRVQVMG